jgi:hypothetical protein
MRRLLILPLLLAAGVASAGTGVPAWQTTLRPDQVPSQYRNPVSARELADGSVMVLVVDGGGVTAVRFNHDGAQLSAAPFHPPFGVAAAAIDPFGGVFISAVANGDPYYGVTGDVWAMKYDGRTGLPLWAAPVFYDGPEHQRDAPSKILVDPRGDLILTAFSASSYRTFKYDGNSGALIWGPATVESVLVGDAAAIDAGGNVFVSVSLQQGYIQFQTLRYAAADGAILWGPVTEMGSPDAAVVDGSGDLYLTSHSPGGPYNINQAVVQRFDGETGAVLWTSVYTGPQNNEGTGPGLIALDPTGDLLLTAGSVFISGPNEFSILKLSGATGSILWGPVTETGLDPGSLSVAGNGDAVVSGFEQGAVYGPVHRRYGRFTGANLWPADPPAPFGGALSFVASNGRVVIAGTEVVGTEVDALLEERNWLTGYPVWSVPFDGSAGTNGKVTDLAAAPDGSVILSGYVENLGGFSTLLARLDRITGAVVWGPKVFPGAGYGLEPSVFVATDASGDVLAASRSEDLVVQKFTGAAGTLVWGPTGVPGMSPRAIRVDANGDAIVVGEELAAGVDIAIFKISGSTGAILWGPVPFDGGFLDLANSLSLDASGNAFVAGRSDLESGVSRGVILKYSGATGALLWGPAYMSVDDASAAVALAIDGVGNPIVTGSGTIKYDGTDGSVLWAKSTIGTALAVDAVNDVLVTGSVYSPVSAHDFVTTKLHGSDGATVWGPVVFNGAANDDDQALQVGVDGAGNAVVSGLSVGEKHTSTVATLKYDGATGALLWGPVVTGDASISDVFLDVRGDSDVVATTDAGAIVTTALTESLGIETPFPDLPPADCGQPYSVTLIDRNGAGGESWSIASGQPPAGMALSPDGILSGTPTEEGAFSLRARVQDSAGASATRDYTLVVRDGDPLVPVTASSGPACAVELSVAGSFAAYEWLPGLQTTPTITVSPTETTTYGVILTDGSGCTRHGAITLHPAALMDPSCLAPTIASISPQSGPATGGQAATLLGTNFQPAAYVTIGGMGAYDVTVDDPTHATLTTPLVSLPPGTVVDVMVLNGDSGSAVLRGGYLLDFADVPTSDQFHDAIARVALAGITVGCGEGNFCGQNLVTRSQIAILLLKAEHGASYFPPPCTGMFADVPCTGPVETWWIEQFAREGITGGCGGGNYCPNAPVTRAQMAPLLLKTRLGSDYFPPPAAGIFQDVPASAFAADWIEDLYARAITGGCAAVPLSYCPSTPVTRGQMAAFLANTFELP